MKLSGTEFIVTILILTVCQVDSSPDSNNAFCEKYQDERVVCFDDRTLGACMRFADSWIGVEIAVCNATYNLCCDASVIGCRVDGPNCSSVGTTTPVQHPTTVEATTPVPQCENGQYKEHPSNCSFFFACTNGSWILHRCPEGKIYSPALKMCMVGEC